MGARIHYGMMVRFDIAFTFTQFIYICAGPANKQIPVCRCWNAIALVRQRERRRHLRLLNFQCDGMFIGRIDIIYRSCGPMAAVSRRLLIQMCKQSTLHTNTIARFGIHMASEMRSLWFLNGYLVY